ncbi:MAG: antibiotic biosynthesis monooxygenase [Acidimicrobiia bacterium]|nr:antibiotic biosynthesis monooxygenase [Acidimicrobiia bacterium]
MDERPVLTVFRSRLREDNVDEYRQTAKRMEELARAMPGLLEFKTYTAEDGERVSVIIFDTPEHHAAWRTHPAHREAQRQGRDSFYAAYDITVAPVDHRRTWPD